MTKRRLLIAVATLVVLFGVAATSFFIGDEYAVGSLSVRQVTPDQLAEAMKADEFFSDFRENTLLVRGRVASEIRDAAAITLAFQTQAGLKTLCEMGQYVSSIQPGNTITIVTEGANAQRLPSGVLLSDCVMATH